MRRPPATPAAALVAGLLALAATGCTMVPVPPPGPLAPPLPARGAPPPRAPVQVEVPPGQMPPPGACRLWFPGRPPGQQPPSGDCGTLQRQVPPGAILLRG